MVKKIQSILICIFLFTPIFLFSQSFSWQTDTTTKNGTPGSTIIFHTFLLNNTVNSIDLRVIRSANQLPSGWTSSFCVFGNDSNCYAPFLDTLPPVTVNGNDQVELTVDIQTSLTPAQGYITVRVEEWNNPSLYFTETFTANTSPTIISSSTLPVSGKFQLYANYPNPFNPFTRIPFEIGGTGNQRTIVLIYNVMGQRVKKILDQNLNPGVHQVGWDGRDAMGRAVSSGIYFVEIRTQNQILLGKMFLLK